MQIFQQAEKIGTLAVKNLRVQKLHKGIPFMINSKELPKGQTYLEYPDGDIQLVAISSNNRELAAIRKLTKKEADAIRTKYNLL